METINEVVCRTVFNFMKDRIDKFIKHETNAWFCDENEIWDNLGYDGRNHFLSKIQHRMHNKTYRFR